MPITPTYNAYRRLRSSSNSTDSDPADIAASRPSRLTSIGLRTLGVGLIGGFGASSGATGHAILAAAGWRSDTFNLSRTVLSSTIGTPVVTLLPDAIIYALKAVGIDLTLSAETRQKMRHWHQVLSCLMLGLDTPIILGLIGALGTLTGSAILGYLPSDDAADVGYAAASGATGTAITGTGIVVVSSVLLCSYILYSIGNSDENNLVIIPGPNLDDMFRTRNLELITTVDTVQPRLNPSIIVPELGPGLNNQSQVQHTPDIASYDERPTPMRP